MPVHKPLRLGRRRRDKTLEFDGRQRVGDVVSLTQSAAEVLKPLPLRPRLDSFRDNLELQNSAEPDHRFGERRFAVSRLETRDE